MRDSSKKATLKISVAAAILLFGGVSACSKPESAEQLVAQAKSYQLQGDNKAAVIELKNALQRNPDDIAARRALGELYMHIGDPVSGEKEFRKAISLGMDQAEAKPMLADALLQQGKYQTVLDETQGKGVSLDARIESLRGEAFFATGRPDEAKLAFEQSLKASPGYADALIGLARWSLVQRDINGASQYVAQAVEKNPKDIKAWLFKGEFERAQGNPEVANTAFDQAIAIDPVNPVARLQKAFLAIEMKKFDLAQSELTAARKIAPANLLNSYGQALLEFNQGKYDVALESLQQVLRGAPEHMPSILLAGATQFSLNALPQAEQHLKKFLESNPTNLYARKMLASTLVRVQRAKEASELLAPYVKDSQDPQLVSIAGEAAMANKDFAGATELFEQAAKMAPPTASLHTGLGMSKLGMGEDERGVAELETAMRLDAKDERPGMLLAMTQMRLGQFDKALVAANALEKAAPANPSIQNLKGGVYAAKGDLVRARASFDKALSLQPDYYPALENLARLDLKETGLDVARKRFQAFLAVNKQSVPAMQALANMLISERKLAEATPLLERAHNVNSNAAQPAIVLGKHYLALKQNADAVTLMRKSQVVNPNHPEVLELLGLAQKAHGDHAGALDTFGRLAATMPNSAPAQLHLAKSQLAMNNVASAAASMKKALVLQPDFLQAQVALVSYELRHGSGKKAIAIARQVQVQRPKDLVGFMLEGDAWMAQGKQAEAVQAYDQAAARGTGGHFVIKTAEALKQIGRHEEAARRVAKWSGDNPDDKLVALYVGEQFIAEKKYQQASAQFQAILKKTPDNVAALNNLAVVYSLTGDKRALPTVEKLLKRNAKLPAVLDTAGSILVEHGQTARGLALLRQAVKGEPESAEYRYHLGVALVKAKDPAGARKELEHVLATSKNFPQAEQVRALLKQL